MELDVRSAFISVVDHLPSDIIRDLWLIQSLNTTYASNEKRIDALLKDIRRRPGNGVPKDEYLLKVKEVNTLAASQLHLRKETLEQARSIVLSIKLTKMRLENQFSQLQHDQQLYQNGVNNSSSSRSKQRNNNRTSKTPNQKLTLTLKLNLKKESPKLKVTKRQQQQQHSKKHSKGSIETSQQEEEERYCICNRTSFGEMVACDNPNCKIEWFHYPCVGLARAPRGKWYCPNCTKKMNKRKH